MIRIDKLSFDFDMSNESFAYDLYAKWDEFCYECFEKIVEEHFKEYDRKKILIQLNELEIDLGTIPEDEFYIQFPIRLREALQNQFNVLGVSNEKYSWQARMQNLLYFLENGFCLTEWTDPDFNITDELTSLTDHFGTRMSELIQICFNKGDMIERLMTQVDDKVFAQLIVYWNGDKGISISQKQQSMVNLSTVRPELIAQMFIKLYQQQSLFFIVVSVLESALQADPSISSSAYIRIELRILEYLPEKIRLCLLEQWKESMLWLSSTSVSLYEKRRYLAIVLDVHPKILIRFIHQTQQNSSIDRLAEILDSIAVRQIIRTECEPNAEVNLPAYWHYLYDWLIEYYPFNGIAIFGDKQHFRKHLNRQLLEFIRKRNYVVYLSKEELTIRFLLEVFGYEYYLHVLNEIFNLQTRNTDGSPIYNGTFNMELYRIFMKFSLLRHSDLPKENGFTKSLIDTRINRAEKLSIFKKIAAEQPEEMIKWLCYVVQNKELTVLLTELVDIRFLSKLTGTFSLYTFEIVSQLEQFIYANASRIRWLSGVNGDQLSFLIRKSMIRWIAMNNGKCKDTQQYTEQFMQLFYIEVVGDNSQTVNETQKKEINNILKQLNMPYADDGFILESGGLLSIQIDKLNFLLRSSSVSDLEKRRILAHFLETYWNQCDRMILALQTVGLLKLCSTLMDINVFELIVVQLSRKANIHLPPVCQWIMAHHSLFGKLSSKVTDRIIVLLANWSFNGNVKNTEAHEVIALFISELFGQEHLQEVFGVIYGSVIDELSENSVPESESLLVILLAITNHNRTSLHEFNNWLQPIESRQEVIEELFDRHLNTSEQFLRWLSSDVFTDEAKCDLLKKYIDIHYKDFIRVIRASRHDTDLVVMLSKVIDVYFLLQVIARNNLVDAKLWKLINELLQTKTEIQSYIGYVGKPVSLIFTQALLNFMLSDGYDNHKELKIEDLISLFVLHLYRACTGEIIYRNTDVEVFKSIEYQIRGAIGLRHKIYDSEYSKSETVEQIEFILTENSSIQYYLISMLSYHYEQFIAFIEQQASLDIIEKLAKEADRLVVEKWLEVVIKYMETDSSVFFRKYVKWLTEDLFNGVLPKSFICSLFLLVKESDWRRKTPQQIVDFFHVHLTLQHQKVEFTVNIEKNRLNEVQLSKWLNNKSVDAQVKRYVITTYIQQQPRWFLEFIIRTIEWQSLPLDYWKDILCLQEWIKLLTSVSISQAEVLQQIITYLLDNQIADTDIINKSLATYLTQTITNNRLRKHPAEVVEQFMKVVEIDYVSNEFIISIKKSLDIIENNYMESKIEPEYILVFNAGLVLLTPWFGRLFDMLKLLDADKNDFIDMKSRIRAIFIIQYLVGIRKQEFFEQELAFNRVLVNCPFSVPLPKQIDLSEEEKGLLDNMLNGVKSNWTKMHNTSIRGFQQSFIERDGFLEYGDQKWTLTVNERAYDVLLDSIPWSFRKVYFKWMKAPIFVKWRSTDW